MMLYLGGVLTYWLSQTASGFRGRLHFQHSYLADVIPNRRAAAVRNLLHRAALFPPRIRNV